MIKGVYGFHSLLLGVEVPPSAGDRRSGFGIKLAQNDGVATRGRCEDEVSERRRSEVEYVRPLCICGRAQDAHIFVTCRRALEGAIVWYVPAFAMSGGAQLKKFIAKK